MVYSVASIGMEVKMLRQVHTQPGGFLRVGVEILCSWFLKKSQNKWKVLSCI